jgi:hypothetical protein
MTIGFILTCESSIRDVVAESWPEELVRTAQVPEDHWRLCWLEALGLRPEMDPMWGGWRREQTNWRGMAGRYLKTT